MIMQSFKIEIDIEGPITTAGLEAPAYGVDTGFLRDNHDRPVLSGSLVKGVVREALEAMSIAAPKLLSSDTIERWFGKASGHVADTSASFDPARSAVRFGDFHLTSPPSPAATSGSSIITRIQVDAETGSVEKGMLQVLESPLASGAVGTFAGTVRVYDETRAADARKWIVKALRLIPALGGVKSAGFGFIVQVRDADCAESEINGSKPKLKTPPDLLQSAGADTFRFALHFDEPFLVASHAISGNLFKGSAVIPGAAVKGALADTLRWKGKLSTLGEALDQVIFRHAKPARVMGNGSVKRPRVIPWSLYSVDDFDRDALNFRRLGDALSHPPETAQGFVAFQNDWKDGCKAIETARKLYGHEFEPAYDIRTRTAISASGVAATSQLFTHMRVIPQKDFVWVGELRRGQCDEKRFMEIVQALSEGLYALGKTRAPAEVTMLPAEPKKAEPYQLVADGRDTKWRIILETDALLHGPGTAALYSNIADGRQRLLEQYKHYFTGAGFEVTDLQFFGRQRWVGGYQARRFSASKDYYPQLLTEAGSVFILTLPASQDEKVKCLAESGLPLPASIPDASLQFERSAFNPENGYGEVTIEARDLTSAVARHA